MTKEMHDRSPVLTDEERLALINKVEKLQLGKNDWLLIRTATVLDPGIAHKLGNLVKTEWPEWEGHVLYLTEDFGLEALHWLARVSLSDVDTVLAEMNKHYE